MTKSKKILIAVDLSTNSLNAVKYVAQQCTPADLRVNLMYVMPTAPEIFWDLEKNAFFREKMRTKYAQWKRDTKKGAQAFLDDARNLLIKAKFKEDHVGVILQERKVGVARDILKECAKDDLKDIIYLINELLVIFICHIPYRSYILPVSSVETSQDGYWNPVLRMGICKRKKMLLICHVSTINTC